MVSEARASLVEDALVGARGLLRPGAAGGPAEKAGVRQADLIIDVAGKRVSTLASFLRAVWQLGPAGTRIPLTLAREGDVQRRELLSVDRNDLLKRPSLH